MVFDFEDALKGQETQVAPGLGRGRALSPDRLAEGPRDRRREPNYPAPGLTAPQAVSAVCKAEHAIWIGRPLSLSVTIVWSRCLAVQEPPHAACTRFLKRLAAWHAQRDLAPVYLLFRENGPREGEHAHLLIGIPPEYRAAFRTWLKGTLEPVEGKGTWGLGVRVDLIPSLPALASVLQYCLKTTMPTVVRGEDIRQLLHLNQAFRPSAVTGRRLLSSQVLSDQAIRGTGARPMRYPEEAADTVNAWSLGPKAGSKECDYLKRTAR